MASNELTIRINVETQSVVRDHCDVESGDLMLPIRNGLFEGRGSVNVLRWRPGESMERVLITGTPWGAITFRVGRYNGGWCWYQIDPPTCPFGRDEYANMAYTLAYGYLPNWHHEVE